jgi:CRP-like cAMP-binding protein
VDVKGLRTVPLFAGLGKRDLEQLARFADEVDVAQGEVLARQGDLGHEFFIIEDGDAAVERDGEHIAMLGPGAFFGEIALISEDARRTATVTATSPMRIVVLSGASFRSLAHTQPEVFETVQAEVARRRTAPA